MAERVQGRTPFDGLGPALADLLQMYKSSNRGRPGFRLRGADVPPLFPGRPPRPQALEPSARLLEEPPTQSNVRVERSRNVLPVVEAAYSPTEKKTPKTNLR